MAFDRRHRTLHAGFLKTADRTWLGSLEHEGISEPSSLIKYNYELNFLKKLLAERLLMGARVLDD